MGIGSERGISVAELQQRLGSTLIRFDVPLPAVCPQLTGVQLISPDVQLSQGSLVLGNAVSASTLASAINACLAARAAMLVLPADLEVPTALREQALAARLALVHVGLDASWLQLAAVVQSMIDGIDGGTRTPKIPLGASAPADLFDLANSLATIIGGPITIENMTSKILAFSADQAEADEPRKRSVLGHQVPDVYASMLRERGFFKELYASDVPYFMPSMGESMKPRVGFRIKAGHELLGSIWAVVAEPLDEHRAKALMEGADIIALDMLRSRTAADAAQRLRLGHLMMLLEGGAEGSEAAARIGFAGDPAAVLALGSVDQSADPVAEEAELERIAGALLLHLHAAHPLAVVGVVGRTVYGVLPMKTGSALSRDAEPGMRILAKEFLDRIGKAEPWGIGLGRVQSHAGLLNASVAEADAALRVLRQRGRQDAVRWSEVSHRIVSAPQVQVESLMIRLSDQLAAAQEPLAGPLASIVAHDQRHGTEYLPTLAAWLDAFGEIGKAAKTCHVHQNTLRYRLTKIAELAEVDLGNAQQRFELMMQIRLFRLDDQRD